MSTKTRLTASPSTRRPAKTASKSLPRGKPAAVPLKPVRSTKASSPRRTRRAAAPTVPSPSTSPADSKQSRLIALLQSSEGGTIDQMTALTGWQAHTVRGTISGVLRKRLGLEVTCAAPEGSGTRIYRITPLPSA